MDLKLSEICGRAGREGLPRDGAHGQQRELKTTAAETDGDLTWRDL